MCVSIRFATYVYSNTLWQTIISQTKQQTCAIQHKAKVCRDVVMRHEEVAVITVKEHTNDENSVIQDAD
jgi:hypothetical protein